MAIAMRPKSKGMLSEQYKLAARHRHRQEHQVERRWDNFNKDGLTGVHEQHAAVRRIPH
jgi:hypothetical protein